MSLESTGCFGIVNEPRTLSLAKCLLRLQPKKGVKSMWSPISLNALKESITESLAVMEPTHRRLWELIRIEPVKWQLHPYGDGGGGFWAVGIFGQEVLWYNDIEEGFNIS